MNSSKYRFMTVVYLKFLLGNIAIRLGIDLYGFC